MDKAVTLHTIVLEIAATVRIGDLQFSVSSAIFSEEELSRLFSSSDKS